MDRGRSFVSRASLAVAAMVGMAGASFPPAQSVGRAPVGFDLARPSHPSATPGTPRLVEQHELRNVQIQQERKHDGDGRIVRNVRWCFRAVAGMKARPGGAILFDRGV